MITTLFDFLFKDFENVTYISMHDDKRKDYNYEKYWRAQVEKLAAKKAAEAKAAVKRERMQHNERLRRFYKKDET